MPRSVHTVSCQDEPHFYNHLSRHLASHDVDSQLDNQEQLPGVSERNTTLFILRKLVAGSPKWHTALDVISTLKLRDVVLSSKMFKPTCVFSAPWRISCPNVKHAMCAVLWYAHLFVAAHMAFAHRLGGHASHVQQSTNVRILCAPSISGRISCWKRKDFQDCQRLPTWTRWGSAVLRNSPSASLCCITV